MRRNWSQFSSTQMPETAVLRLTNNPRIQAEFYNENKHDAPSVT